jgi:hypothetical protein
MKQKGEENRRNMDKKKAAFPISSKGDAEWKRKKPRDNFRGLYLVYRSIWELKLQLLTGGDSGYIEDEIRLNLLENLTAVEQKLRGLLNAFEEEPGVPSP